nr:hypothetical protein PJ912_06225 [Pectobacterium colocasium]
MASLPQKEFHCIIQESGKDKTDSHTPFLSSPYAAVSHIRFTANHIRYYSDGMICHDRAGKLLPPFSKSYEAMHETFHLRTLPILCQSQNDFWFERFAC